jgi:excisionase family DNA binding protein
VETLLTPTEVAKRLRKRKEAVLSLIHSGRLPALNLPGPSGKPRYKVRPADLDAFEQSHVVKNDAPRRPKMPPGVIDFYAATSKRGSRPAAA